MDNMKKPEIKDIKAAPAAVKKRASGFTKEFKEFISRGNVVDLAVGVIIGAAFGKIVTSLVNDILMPVIGAVMGGVNFSSLEVTLWGNARITYGNFIQTLIDFVIVAFSIFVFIKLFNGLTRKKKPEPVADKTVKKVEDTQTVLLREIRDELKKRK